MTNWLKGFIVHLDKDYKEDTLEQIKEAIRMIKHVRIVEPLVSGPDDWIAYERGWHDCRMKVFESFRESDKKKRGEGL